ncbi:hypothetical protein QE416_002252 [Microbacterium sp. SORGH_AS 421]|nr:hypothetical protein [Microbacterium sp. SORGH_AS_0421]
MSRTPRPATEAVLAPARGVRVVLDRDGGVETLLETRAEGLVTPVDVRRVDDGAAVAADEAGGGHADRVDLVGAAQMIGHVDHGVHEGRGVDGSVDTKLLDDGAVVVDDAPRDLRSSDVDADVAHRAPFRAHRAARPGAV